jgi:chaperonin GroES
MKVRPLQDRVIVRRMEEERKTASGIFIPDAATEKPDQGEIIAVGKGKVAEDGKLIAMSVKVGDKVLFGKYAGQAFKMDGQEYMTMREDDIIGVIEA